jgi:precorrin-2 dehydrogenase/sirohydrochlorin ferrochelatase
MTKYYPIMLNIEGKKCVIVGGGNVAFRKIRSLFAYGAEITVISPDFTEEIKKLTNIERISRDYEFGDLKGAYLAFGATDDKNTNKQVYNEAKLEGIPVNIADNPELCGFMVPSKVERGDLTIAISTNGKIPALSKKIRLELEEQYGSHYAEFLDLIADIRRSSLEKIDEENKRKELLEKLIYSDLLDKLKQGKTDEVKRKINEIFGG